jgi:hypothetical protein
MTIIGLTPMKTKALNFPEPLKSLILSEPEMIDAQEFISKLGTWERLLRMDMVKRI